MTDVECLGLRNSVSGRRKKKESGTHGAKRKKVCVLSWRSVWADRNTDLLGDAKGRIENTVQGKPEGQTEGRFTVKPRPSEVWGASCGKQ